MLIFIEEPSPQQHRSMEAYQLAIPDERPRRLLHIASMTSTERVPGNVQGHDTQPKM